MDRFEVKEVYISDVVLNDNDYAPKRKLNIQVELTLEAQPNYSPTTEEIAKELGDTIAKTFSKNFTYNGGGMTMEKKEIIIRSIDNGFGWYEFNAYNQKIAEEIEKAHKEYEAV